MVYAFHLPVLARRNLFILDLDPTGAIIVSDVPHV
jgi:hypothetical protein